MKKPYIIGVILAGILLLTIIALLEQYKTPLGEENMKSESKKYAKHYVLIAKDMSTSFWQSVYESAKKEAEDNDIYLEQIGSNLSEEYSLEDYLRISIAEQVDGIIISPDGTEGVAKLIKEAADNKIPVITVLNDESDSSRVSFVGINSYELGLVYAGQIMKQITKNTRNIYILFHSDESNSVNDVVFNQIKKTLNDTFGDHVNIQPYYISNKNEFDSEEAIRDIFVSSDTVPDILVCMEEIDTECACQAIVDYNKVGKVTIIGSYSSDIILEAIKKNLAALTVAIDTEQLGKQSVQALMEYQDIGYVNNYYNVNLDIINPENIDSYSKNSPSGEREKVKQAR